MTENSQSLYERIGGEEGIAKLLKHFYADVRQHNLIGPIFNRQIEDWPSHLAKIGQFWARVTGGPSTYAGPMPMKHFPLGLEAAHFAVWLELWDFNCRIYLKPVEAKEMSNLAHEVGKRLSQMVSMAAGTHHPLSGQ
jgi:hemoglobin